MAREQHNWRSVLALAAKATHSERRLEGFSRILTLPLTNARHVRRRTGVEFAWICCVVGRRHPMLRVRHLVTASLVGTAAVMLASCSSTSNTFSSLNPFAS